MVYHHHSNPCVHSCTFETKGSNSNKVRAIWTTLVLVGCFSLVELAIGCWSHSLSLMADSGHMISDSLALGISLLAAWISQFPTASKTNSGYRRVEILSALVNGIGLVALALWIAWEAIVRLSSPPADILSVPMLITAGIGLGVNSVSLILLHPTSKYDINLRGAFLHVLADAISSVGVILAAIAVWVMHWLWADCAIGLFVSGLIVLSAIPLIVHSLNILLKNSHPIELGREPESPPTSLR